MRYIKAFFSGFGLAMMSIMAIAGLIMLSVDIGNYVTDWLKSKGVDPQLFDFLLTLLIVCVVIGFGFVFNEYEKHKQRKGDYDRGDFM